MPYLEEKKKKLKEIREFHTFNNEELKLHEKEYQ